MTRSISLHQTKHLSRLDVVNVSESIRVGNSSKIATISQSNLERADRLVTNNGLGTRPEHETNETPRGLYIRQEEGGRDSFMPKPFRLIKLKTVC